MSEISVLMAVYNGERYLGQAIESILGQSFSDFEFLDRGRCQHGWHFLDVEGIFPG